MGLRRIAAAATAAAALSSSILLGGSGPASAAEHNSSCEVVEICFYYNSNLVGAKHDFRFRVPDFGPYTFLAPGAGAGVVVKNNAASARSYDGYFTARVYYNSNYSGPADDVAPLTWRNLADTYNDNASMNWCHNQPLECM